MGDWLFYLIAALMFAGLGALGGYLLSRLDDDEGPE